MMKAKNIGLAAASAGASLLATAVVRTLLTPSKVSDYVPGPDEARAMEYAEKLAEMIRCETVPPTI